VKKDSFFRGPSQKPCPIFKSKMAASTSSSANIVKILINYSEYARLKDIEEKYTQLQKKYKDKLHIEEGNSM